MSRTLFRWTVTVVSIGLAAIGLGGIPDDAPQWAQWLEPLDGNLGRWLLVLCAVSLLLSVYVVPGRLWDRVATVFTPTTDATAQERATAQRLLGRST